MLTRTALGILNSRYAAVLRHCRFVIMAAMFYPSFVNAADYYGSGVEGHAKNVFGRTEITENDSTITGTFEDFNESVFQNRASGVNVFDAYFNNNENNSNGGAIYNDTGSITFNGDAAFESNTANNYCNGGAIYNSIGTITFNGDATFNGNTTNSSGGAIESYGIITFNSNATFQSNTTNYSGGAIDNINGTITFNGNATFQSNTANNSGGAIDSTWGTITFNGDTAFNGNTANYTGGAIYNIESTITFNGDVAFEGNTSTNRGGAIDNGNRSSITFNGNTLFQGNTVNGSPNAFFLNGYNPGSKSVLNIQPAAGKTFTDYDGMKYDEYATINIGGAGTINLLGGIVNKDGTAAGKDTAFQTINNGEKAFSGHLVIGRKNVAVTNVNLSGGTLVFDLNGYTAALDVGNDIELADRISHAKRLVNDQFKGLESEIIIDLASVYRNVPCTGIKSNAGYRTLSSSGSVEIRFRTSIHFYLPFFYRTS